ncbi:MAG: hypothetical protein HW389_3134, partial [Bacteroidetes bacterium]|nr:hypothetical protein [Bacteroidota bacterium]
MAWMEEEQKRIIADAAERGKGRRAQYKKIIRIAGVVAFLALVVLAVDMFTREKGARLPMDLGDPDGTVAEWEREGFVKSIDDTASTVVVDETVWNEISDDEKTTIVAFLGSYWSERR